MGLMDLVGVLSRMGGLGLLTILRLLGGFEFRLVGMGLFGILPVSPNLDQSLVSVRGQG
jgi:hypothetical protein